MRRALGLLLLALAGCDAASGPAPARGDGAALEAAAIGVGLLPAADGRSLEGRYERRSDLGIDRFCAIRSGSTGFRVGLVAVFGPDSLCEAQGMASVAGEAVTLDFGGGLAGSLGGGCRFVARFDGNEIRLPGEVPAACARLCSGRASLAGTSFVYAAEGAAAARATAGRTIARLCAP